MRSRTSTIGRVTRATALTGAGTLLAAAAATGASAHQVIASDGVIDSGKATHAHDLQHEAEDGHLAPVGPTGGLRLLSTTTLKNVVPGKIADVGVLGDTAYLAAWGGRTCKYNGVHVVDITDLATPREVAFIQAKEGSYPGEGVQALSIDTAAFTGDVLLTNNETCKDGVGFGGLNIYDVTHPSRPVPLTEGYGDDVVPGAGKKDAHEIHSVFAWQAAGKAYAVMVDNEETTDVDIVDISNPKDPRLIAEYDLAERFPAILQPGRDLDEVFLHDMVVEEVDGRQVMLASYWDAGYVQLDVTDPRDIRLLAQSDFAPADPELLTVAPEGNAHQAEFTADDRYVIAADEDFAPYALATRNTTDGTDLDASQGSDTTQLEEGETITGESVFAGRACDTDLAVPAGGAGTQIAVVERGLCDFTSKVANVVEAGGYEAVLVFNRTAADGCNAALRMSVAGALPTFGVAPRQQGLALFDLPYDDAACLAGDGTQTVDLPLGTTGDSLSLSSSFDGWGYVHLYDGASMAELDTYAVPEAHDPAYAEGFGDLSVHEVATSSKDASLGYISYYSAGLRVVAVEDDGSGPALVEKAAHISQGGGNLWGVEVFEKDGKEYVAASDRDSGLSLYEYTPVN